MRTIRVFGRVVPSEVDGPGLRAVVHLAGCTVRCPGCFNRDIWDASGPNVRRILPEQLAEEMLAVSPHVTISGGEPTDQFDALVDLLCELRDRGAQSVILFTGRRAARSTLAVFEVLELVDVVVDGPFVASLPEREWLRGSRNQEIHVLSERVRREDLRQHSVQILVDGDRVTVTGFPDESLTEDLEDGT